MTAGTEAANPVGSCPSHQLERHLGLFDTGMIVVGGMIGSGIFMSPYVAARILNSSSLILFAWILGGVLAICGAASFAELASQRPNVGGQYSYLRDAYHPSIAFLYGWGLLVIAQSGGMAAVALTAARYLSQAIAPSIPERAIAVALLASVTVVNCMGAHTWTAVQSVLTTLKSAVLVALIMGGLIWIRGSAAISMSEVSGVHNSVVDFGAAMVPIMFAYGGWQTSCFLAGEVRNPRYVLPRALLVGVASVTTLYVLFNFVLLRALGPGELAATSAPAASLVRRIWGSPGVAAVSVGVALAAIGFLNQCILTVPRVYYAMAKDKLFFQGLTKLHSRSRMPVRAISLQGGLAAIYTLVGGFEQILTWMVAVDFLFYGLAAACVFVFRYRNRNRDSEPAPGMAGHPFTTGLFVAACAFVVLTSLIHSPLNNSLGLVLVATGIPAYLVWNRRRLAGTGSNLPTSLPE